MKKPKAKGKAAEIILPDITPKRLSPRNMKASCCACDAIFAYRSSAKCEENDSETVIADLLCDLMHTCEGFEIDFEALLSQARAHFHAETSATCTCGIRFDAEMECDVNGSAKLCPLCVLSKIAEDALNSM